MISMQCGDEVCLVGFTLAEYRDGSTAVQMFTDEWEPFCSLSVWFPQSAKLKPGEFYVNDWSENEKIAAKLIEEGYIEPVDAPMAKSGFVVSRAHQLTEKGKEHIC